MEIKNKSSWFERIATALGDAYASSTSKHYRQRGVNWTVAKNRKATRKLRRVMEKASRKRNRK